MQIESKLEAARVRRHSSLQLREGLTRAANQRQGEVSREALQRKWLEEEERSRQAFLLKQSSADQQVLRRVYRGLLQRVASWRVEEQREVRGGGSIGDDFDKNLHVRYVSLDCRRRRERASCKGRRWWLCSRCRLCSRSVCEF